MTDAGKLTQEDDMRGHEVKVGNLNDGSDATTFERLISGWREDADRMWNFPAHNEQSISATLRNCADMLEKRLPIILNALLSAREPAPQSDYKSQVESALALLREHLSGAYTELDDALRQLIQAYISLRDSADEPQSADEIIARLGTAVEKDYPDMPASQRQRAREIAEKLLDAISAEEVLNLPSGKSLEKELEIAKQFILDAERAARLDEARWWHAATNCTQSEAREMNERIAELEKP